MLRVAVMGVTAAYLLCTVVLCGVNWVNVDE